MRIAGHVYATLYDPETGLVAARRSFPNLVTELGDALVASRLSDDDIDAISHFAVGSGTGATAADTELIDELARVALDSLTRGTGDDDNSLLYSATFAAGVGTGLISEVGLFNASTDGVLAHYACGFIALNKTSGLALTLDWPVRIGLS